MDPEKLNQIKTNQEKQLSVIDIIKELNSGIATTKFILKRFNKWLPFDRIDGSHYYDKNTIPILIKIKESLDSGMLPSEIEQDLENPSDTDPLEMNPMEDIEKHFLEQPNEDIRVSRDGLSLIKSIFNDIKGHQARIAIAHEKRAEAEERKAGSIEKRAEAEEKKAIAMNNIANALQEMNKHRLQDGETREIALQSVQAIAENEIDSDGTDSLATDPQETDSEIITDASQEDGADIFDIPAPAYETLEASDIEMDDLSALIDDEPADGKAPDEEPDLEQDQEISQESLDMDDLSLLIGEDSIPGKMDDLSLLIDSSQTVHEETPADEAPMDDLGALIDDKEERDEPMDDLAALLEKPLDKDPLDNITDLDDLSALIDETPSLKPDITPEDGIEKYKATVMKIILGLKSDGSSAQETMERLNRDGVQTLSGKPGWSEKAISQIYKFIDSAK